MPFDTSRQWLINLTSYNIIYNMAYPIQLSGAILLVPYLSEAVAFELLK